MNNVTKLRQKGWSPRVVGGDLRKQPTEGDEDARLDRQLAGDLELLRRKIVAIRGPEFAIAMMQDEIDKILYLPDCQGE